MNSAQCVNVRFSRWEEGKLRRHGNKTGKCVQVGVQCLGGGRRGGESWGYVGDRIETQAGPPRQDRGKHIRAAPMMKKKMIKRGAVKVRDVGVTAAEGLLHGGWS